MEFRARKPCAVRRVGGGDLSAPVRTRKLRFSAEVEFSELRVLQTCWDSDRLDLGRVGITPHPNRLCTAVAKRPEPIKWADGRASFGVVPKLVNNEWGIYVE